MPAQAPWRGDAAGAAARIAVAARPRVGPRQHARLVARATRRTTSRERSCTSSTKRVLPIAAAGRRAAASPMRGRRAIRTRVRAVRDRGGRGRDRAARSCSSRPRRSRRRARAIAAWMRWTPGARIANMLPDSLLICGFVTAGYCYRRRALGAARRGWTRAARPRAHRRGRRRSRGCRRCRRASSPSSCSTRWRAVERLQAARPEERRAAARRAHRLPARRVAAPARDDVDRVAQGSRARRTRTSTSSACATAAARLRFRVDRRRRRAEGARMPPMVAAAAGRLTRWSAAADDEHRRRRRVRTSTARACASPSWCGGSRSPAGGAPPVDAVSRAARTRSTASGATIALASSAPLVHRHLELPHERTDGDHR